MRKILWAFFSTCLFVFPLKISAQSSSATQIQASTHINYPTNHPSPKLNSLSYLIEEFKSNITVNQDTSLTVKETIIVNFLVPKHGIFRLIPIVYSDGIKTIRAKFTLLSVTDNNNKPYPYTTERYFQSIKIKIGDPQRTIKGLHTYVIKYKISDVLRRYQEYDEVYWNVVGSEWDTTIKQASAEIYSPFAPIEKTKCFAGPRGTRSQNCQAEAKNNSSAIFRSSIPLGYKKDFTIVVALNQNNQLQFPSLSERIAKLIWDNWAYLLAFLPLIIMGSVWYKRGRDLQFVANQIFYRPKNQKSKLVPLLSRPHLPSVYAPIQGLTPAEVGTIIDERVDLQDVIAEIIELARLGHFEIRKIEEKKLFRKKTDYFFIKKLKGGQKLKEHQKYLLEKLFNHPLKVSEIKKIASNLSGKQKTILMNKGAATAIVRLSDLRTKFYQYLDPFKEKLYQGLIKQKIFEGNPERIRRKWWMIFIVLESICLFTTFSFAKQTGTLLPLLVNLITLLPAYFLTRKMPRRLPWGYSLYRQIVGLHWYLQKGKWREEIAEKHLFLEEILPLAICLGVVKKLARQMAILGLPPPTYLQGFDNQHFYHEINLFSQKSAGAFLAVPSGQWSGKSTWSGSSGFSSRSSGGGSAGGGFGGGGGGSW